MKRERVRELDLLRFVAAIMVVLFHYTFRGYAADSLTVMPYPGLGVVSRYGFLGVELFFLISGFVILRTATDVSFRGFVASRVARLFPAFWFCCSVTAALALMLHARRFMVSPVEFAVNLSMLAGLLGVKSVDGAYWSLYVELRFYFLISVLLIVNQMRNAEHWLFAWLGASVLLEIWPIGILRFVLIGEYAALFIGGGLCFLVWKEGYTLQRQWGVVAAYVLAALQLCRTLPEASAHYGANLRPSVAVGILGMAFLAVWLVATQRSGALGRRDWIVVGSMTYPLYLLHQYIGYMVFDRWYPALNPHLLVWGTILGLCILSAWVYRYIERPLGGALRRSLIRS